MSAVAHQCVDCQTDEAEGRLHGIRKLVTEKRCFTHERTRAKLARKGKRASTVLRTRGITAEQSHELLVFQGGVCWLCRRATGTSKALAHDHDHAHCPGPDSCPECLRGRLCSTCNRILGHLRDDPGAFDRAAAYLRGDTPWRRLVAVHWLGDPQIKVWSIIRDTDGNRYIVAGGPTPTRYQLPTMARMLERIGWKKESADV